jgi:hypothetical protein
VTTALRATVVILAVGAAYFLLASRDSDAACNDAHERVFATSGGFEPLAGLEPAIDDLRRDCDGATGLLAAAETIPRRATVVPSWRRSRWTWRARARRSNRTTTSPGRRSR